MRTYCNTGVTLKKHFYRMICGTIDTPKVMGFEQPKVMGLHDVGFDWVTFGNGYSNVFQQLSTTNTRYKTNNVIEIDWDMI